MCRISLQISFALIQARGAMQHLDQGHNGWFQGSSNWIYSPHCEVLQLLISVSASSFFLKNQFITFQHTTVNFTGDDGHCCLCKLNPA